MTDQERAERAIAVFNHRDAYVIHREVVKSILARELAEVRADERRAIAAWLRERYRGWEVVEVASDRIERGEHGT